MLTQVFASLSEGAVSDVSRMARRLNGKAFNIAYPDPLDRGTSFERGVQEMRNAFKDLVQSS